MSTIVKYGIFINGQIANIKFDKEDHSFVLVTDPRFPEWLVNDEQVLTDLLFENTPRYDSQFSRPSWGKFKREQLTPVKITKTTEEINIDLLQNVQPVQCREINYRVAKIYDKDIFKDDNMIYIFCIIKGNIQDYLPKIDKTVCFDSIFEKRKILSVCVTPEEYKTSSDDTCLLICAKV
jgi:hypothetical protein